MNQKVSYQIQPIGRVRRSAQQIYVEVDEAFRPALEQLDHFSHVMVFWWADRLDDPKSRSELQCLPPYAEDHVTGMFATRSPMRPNPIGMTTCKLLEFDQALGRLRVNNLDALDGTPVIDLKAYFPVCDRVEDAHIPEWLVGWPEWMPEEGIGLMEYELENAG